VPDTLASRVRANYPILGEITYLNTGTVGIMSESVLNSHLNRIAGYERAGHFGEAQAREGFERARERVARLIGATSEEVAMTRNASDGVNLVMSSLQFGPDAGLLTTDEEHPAVLLPLSAAERRTGAPLRMFSIAKPDDELLESFEAAISEGIALAIFSHVSCETGRRLPVRQMCDICRRHGVISLVDGAQSVGQFPVDVRPIGCDFLTGNGHKWLCGPKGTGFLYVSRDVLDRTTPAFVGDGAIEPAFRREDFTPVTPGQQWQFAFSARRFEFGTRNWHSFGALTDAIDEFEGYGWSDVESHCARLSTVLKTSLGERPVVTLHSPLEWRQSSGLVTFSVEGWRGEDLADVLWNRYNIIQRRVQSPNGIRVSIAAYTNQHDVERLLAAIDELSTG
jgi:selenocysteine lyase/cysteine desulfurase